MGKKIYFIEKSISFNSHDLNSVKIGGSEKTLINISNALAKFQNFTVKVFNKTKEKIIINNVEWNNLTNININDEPDYLISMSDANLLSLMDCKNKFLWSHSVQSFEKFIRKKQFIPVLKHKPLVFVESKYHYNNRSFFTSPFGKEIIHIAVDYDFINTKIDENYLPYKNAIFSTRSDRNLNFLLKCWESIKVKTGNSNLFINPPFLINEKYRNLDVKLRTKGHKSDLIKDLLNSKVMLVPGHKGEVFCLAAEEARELCLPIVTMGYGSLKERVEHGVTGFIANNEKEFIDYSIQLLNDDNLYYKIKKNLIKKRNSRNYKNVAHDLIKILKIKV
ncbi:MAG: glycosyltransferase [Candidatus Pelagibacter sp.]